jgi:putative glycosyltransferase (TIGR04372 family)
MHRIALGVLTSICRLLDVRFVVLNGRFIGHLAVEPDLVIKENVLRGRTRRRDVLIVPRDTAANRHLVRYWKRYFWIAERPLLCRLLTSVAVRSGLTYPVETRSHPIGRFDGDASKMGYAATSRRWADRRALLSLTSEDEERGRVALARLGVPPGAWFVCFHNRTAGFTLEQNARLASNGGRVGYDSAFRDFSVTDFVPAMQSVVEAGGWCVRMGDANMDRLEEQKGVIDYAHSDAVSAWMDVVLCASCRFFVGCNSGLCDLASIFGRPLLRTNAAPMASCPANRRGDLGLPKLMVREGRVLAFPEVMGSEIGTLSRDADYRRLGVSVLDSDPADIRGAVLEMLATLDGTIRYSEADELRRTRYEALFRPHHLAFGTAMPCRPARGFLERHEALLDRERIPMTRR